MSSVQPPAAAAAAAAVPQDRAVAAGQRANLEGEAPSSSAAAESTTKSESEQMHTRTGVDAATNNAGSSTTLASSSTPSPASYVPSPLHLVPPTDLQTMLHDQQLAIGSLRRSNHAFVSFHEYASKSYDQIMGLHNTRIARLSRLRENLTEIFVRIRRLRIQLHERTPGLEPYKEDEDLEQAEIEELKRTLKAEQEEALEAHRRELSASIMPAATDLSNFFDADTSVPYATSMPNSIPPTPGNILPSIASSNSSIVVNSSFNNTANATLPPPSDASLAAAK